jgi:pantothenate kinase type III
MRPQMLMFIILVLLVGNLVGLMADGAWLGADDSSQMNAMVGQNTQQSVNIPIVTPVVNFAKGLWKAISWDFSFLAGGLQIVRWFLLCITAGCMYAIAQEYRSTITSLFGRR